MIVLGLVDELFTIKEVKAASVLELGLSDTWGEELELTGRLVNIL